MSEGFACGLDVRSHPLVVDLRLEEALDFREEGHNGAATIHAELSANQIKRLDAVGAFVNLTNSGIADELLHAVLGDVAVTAINLLRQDCVCEAGIGAKAFDHRR